MIAGEGGIVPIPDPEKIVKNFLESFKRRLKKVHGFVYFFGGVFFLRMSQWGE